MKNRLSSLAAAALLVAALTSTATARTTDGQTPAEESVCDDLRGAEHGLCVSYCEAMDCGDPDYLYDEDADERRRIEL